MNTRLLVTLSLMVVGVLVIVAPSIFFFQLTPAERARRKGLVSRDDMKKQSLESEKRVLLEELTQTTRRVKELKSKMPWVGQPDPSLVHALQNTQYEEERIRAELMAVHSTREALITAQRAVTPMWSSLAFEEAREVWWARQSEHAGVSVQVWKWDMLFDGLFGGMRHDRDEGLAAVVIGAILKLLWRLTAGAVFGLIDFCIRIPFYLKEYDIFDFDDSVHASPEDVEQEAARVRIKAAQTGAGEDFDTRAANYDAEYAEGGAFGFNLAELEAEVGKVERSSSANGWLSFRTLSLMLVWMIVAAGATVATTVLILLVWSPVIALLGCAIYNQRQQRQRMGEHGRPHYE